MRWKVRTRLLLVAALTLVAAAPSAGAQTDSSFTIGQHAGTGAIFLDGELYAWPLAAPQDLLLVDNGLLLVADSIVGLVGVGGPLGQDPENPDLAARQVFYDDVDGLHTLELIDFRRVLGLSASEVIDFNLGAEQVTVLYTGTTPDTVEFIDGGFVVLDASAGALVVSDTALSAPATVAGFDLPELSAIAATSSSLYACSAVSDQVFVFQTGSSEPPIVLDVPAPTSIVALPIGATPENTSAVIVVSDSISELTFIDPTTNVPVPFDPAVLPTSLDELPEGFTLSELDVSAPEASTTSSTTTTLDPAAASVTTVPAAPVSEPDSTTPGASEPASGSTTVFWIAALIAALISLGWIIRAWLMARGLTSHTPGGAPDFGVFAEGAPTVTGTGPCAELEAAAAAAEEACEQARAAAERAANEASEVAAARDEAAATRAAAQRDQRDAAAELASASEIPEEGSSISDDEGRITQRDLRLKSAASAAAWGRYEAGEITAAELEQTWSELGERDAIDRLRAEDEATRGARRAAAAARKEKADQALAEAESAHDAARTGADEAAARAEAAAAASDEACARADQAAQELAACRRRAEEERARAIAEAAAAAEQAARDEARAAAARRDEEAEEERRRIEAAKSAPTFCCPEGLWIGYGWNVAGHSLIAGIETTTLYMFCASDMSKYVYLTAQTLRIGPGLGGESNAVGAIAIGLHGSEVPDAIRGALNGVNGDLSIGVPATKLLKSTGQAAGAGKAVRLLQKLAKKKTPPWKLSLPDLASLRAASHAARVGTKTATKAAAKSGRQGIKQGAQASEATGFVFPLGPGLQVGLWRGISTKIWVTGHNTCGECTPVGFSRG